MSFNNLSFKLHQMGSVGKAFAVQDEDQSLFPELVFTIPDMVVHAYNPSADRDRWTLGEEGLAGLAA